MDQSSQEQLEQNLVELESRKVCIGLQTALRLDGIRLTRTRDHCQKTRYYSRYLSWVVPLYWNEENIGASSLTSRLLCLYTENSQDLTLYKRPIIAMIDLRLS